MAKNAKKPNVTRKPTVAVQLIIFGKRAREDLAGVLDDVAKAGYQGVETGMMAAHVSGKDFRKMLQDRGLVHVGAHWSGDKADQIGPVLDWLRETGATDLPMSDLDTRELSADLYKRKAEVYNAAGRRCAEAGIALSYHNHNWELGRIGDRLALEFLYERTDPAALKACIDVYWVRDGGQDPAAFVRKHAARLRILHAKDSFTEERDQRSFCPVGAGVLDFPAIFAAAAASPAPWVVVEQDVPRAGTTPADECALSRKFIKEMIGL